MKRAGLALVVLVLGGCAAHPPARWAQGGAPLVMERSRWERPGDTVDLLPDGRVLIDGDLQWTIDTAGRVYDSDNRSVALLEPSGALVGNDDRALGIVGTTNASPPSSEHAWLSILPGGRVERFEPDGERLPGGGWAGCQGPALRTCVLVSHLVTLRDQQRRSRSGISFGVGVGVGVGVGGRR